MTLVSVIVPTYDRPAFIEGAVETALAQTHDELEVVIVCDPPAVETRDVLERYDDDDRVRPIYNEERLGIAASRNRAIEHARGEYLCILDDDDRWDPDKVEKQLAVMDANPDCGVVYTGGFVRQNGRIVGTYSPSMRGDIYPEILAGFSLKPYSSHMIRAECFETVGGYDTDFECGEDWDHTIRLAREYEYEYVDEPLVVRQFHEQNVSQGFAEQVEQPHLDLDKAMDISGQLWSKYRKEIERYPEIERRLRYSRHVSYGWTEIDRNNRQRAFKYGWKATKFGPSVASLAVCCFALLGPAALDFVRSVRDTVVDSQFDQSAETKLDPRA
ncbi:glycosyltransferase [Natronorubrum sp. JWXQ-INN-674]|uniref:Glycosyltransferase n=1 Tax=Natronorubrum halalkaliphilum TaxID=2691917 RepID=A0A6B0VRH6_9EURY|nr:glycosyltransferase family A protein [Natronorubrum halalkaliphilum]MXV64128.1 glycosyltransferase [Natronorubrum halalkaliphilum]